MACGKRVSNTMNALKAILSSLIFQIKIPVTNGFQPAIGS
jgi:hypothetical protein